MLKTKFAFGHKQAYADLIMELDEKLMDDQST